MSNEISNNKQPPKEPKKEGKPTVVEKRSVEPNQVNSMVPLFSWRSITVIAIGLIIGLSLGLSYWAFSPSSVVTEEEPTNDGGFLQSIGIGPAPPTEPWVSEVKIQVVNPGSTYVSMTQLSSMGIYYAAKVKSLPFLQFLSNDLAENSPMYRHTVDELDEIINTKYDSNSEQPTFLLRVITPTADESLFLANRVTAVFQDFLMSEESNQEQQMRNNLLLDIEDVKIAIIEAEQEVRTLEAQGVSGIINDPQYIALNTRVTALESELVRQASVLATMNFEENTDGGNTREKEYENTLLAIDLVKKDIVEAQQKLNILLDQQTEADITNDPKYINLTAEIGALESQIDIIMNGRIDAETGLPITGLAEMIATGTTSGAAYEYAKNQLDTASQALADDRKQLAVLESNANENQIQLSLDIRIAQTELDTQNTRLEVLLEDLQSLVYESDAADNLEKYDKTSTALGKARQELAALEIKLASSQLSQNLDYQIAQSRIDTLNNELSVLNDSLSSTFVSTGGALAAIDSLAIGNPSVPEVLFPDRVKARNALAIGAILGMIIAWAILNYRWLRKVLTSSGEEAESQ
jgi:hypothetical protein